MPVVFALGSPGATLLGGVAALCIGDRRHPVLGLIPYHLLVGWRVAM